MVFNLRWAKPAVLEVIGQPYNIIFPSHIYQTEFLETGRLDSMREKPSKATTGAFRVALSTSPPRDIRLRRTKTTGMRRSPTWTTWK